MKRILFLILILSSLNAKSQDIQVAIPLDSGIQAEWVEPEKVFDQPKELSVSDLKSIEGDKAFLKRLPSSYDNVSPKDMKNLVNQLDNQLERLTREKEALLKSHASQEAIDSKDGTINVIGKEKKIVSLTLDKNKLEQKSGILGIEKERLKRYLIVTVIVLSLLILIIVVLLQKKTIGIKNKKIEKQIDDINKKNNYLEHAARIIRHDMHSGINTYMPRGIASLEKRITEEQAKELKIDGSIKMIKEGLSHTQKVYKSVYEFTNLVKSNPTLEIEEKDLKQLLVSYIESTSYKLNVEVSDLGTHRVNQHLFCTAIDNLIRNGLKFNSSENKQVKIFTKNNLLIVEDNGNGLSSEDFEKIKKNKNKQGLGLNICIAILEEHKFSVSAEKLNQGGTQIKIRLK
jgi:K+-sensing histidine kinase KdpD